MLFKSIHRNDRLATLDFIGLIKQCKTLLGQISAVIKKHVPVKYQYEHDKPYQTFLLIVEKHLPEMEVVLREVTLAFMEIVKEE
jgi:hypothetical protein